MSYEFWDKDFENLTAKGRHYNVCDEDFTLHFVPDEDDVAKPAYVTYTVREFMDGAKVNIETTSNGYVVRSGKQSKIVSDTYDLSKVIDSFTKKDVPKKKPFVAKEFEAFDMENLMLEMNVANKSSDKAA